MSDDLWTWACAAYAAPGVAEACLSLQDDYGQCVSFLLWRLWALSEGRAVDAKLLGDAVIDIRNGSESYGYQTDL